MKHDDARSLLKHCVRRVESITETVTINAWPLHIAMMFGFALYHPHCISHLARANSGAGFATQDAVTTGVNLWPLITRRFRTKKKGNTMRIRQGYGLSAFVMSCMLLSPITGCAETIQTTLPSGLSHTRLTSELSGSLTSLNNLANDVSGRNLPLNPNLSDDRLSSWNP